MIEYGIRWSFRDGETLGHVGGGYTLDGARKMLAGAGDPKLWSPYAVRVVERDVSEWREAEIPCGVSDSEPKTTAPKGRLGAQVKTAPALRQQRDPGPNRYEGAADE